MKTTMKLASKTKAELVNELQKLQRQNKKLERQNTEHKKELNEIKSRTRTGISKKNTHGKISVRHMEILQHAVDAAEEIVFTTDKEGIITFINPAFTKVYGHDKDDVVGKVTPRILKSNMMDASVYDYFWENLSNRKVISGELINLTKDGRLLSIEGSANPIINNHNEICGYLAIQRDITQKKGTQEELNSYQAKLEYMIEERTIQLQKTVDRLENEIEEREKVEEALRISEKQFEIIFKEAPTMVLISTLRKGEIIDANDAFIKTTEYSKEEVIGKLTVDFYNNPEDRKYLVDQIKKNGSIRNFEFELKKKSGGVFTGLLSSVQIDIENEHYLLSVITDLTDRKISEEQIQTALNEKEILLREIHHRVKNNLQTIIYLIDMQIEKSGDLATITSLKELQSRARTMSLVHEQLYHSKNLSQIYFEEYLKSLTENLFKIFGVKSNIKFNLHTTVPYLNMETAIPCGMIINELITNSVKYAFPQNFTRGENWLPEISISFDKSEAGFVLNVHDNGIGISHNPKWKENDSLGLKLVNIWATYQLGGKLEINSMEGTNFKIVFGSLIQKGK